MALTVDDVLRRGAKEGGDDSMTRFEPELYLEFLNEGILWLMDFLPARLFRFLVTQTTSSLTQSSGAYDVDPPEDFEDLVEARRDGVICDRYEDPRLFEELKAGSLPQLAPDDAKPAVLFLDDKLQFLPAASGGDSTIDLTYIKIPGLQSGDDYPLPERTIAPLSSYIAGRSLTAGAEPVDIEAGQAKLVEAARLLRMGS